MSLAVYRHQVLLTALSAQFSCWRKRTASSSSWRTSVEWVVCFPGASSSVPSSLKPCYALIGACVLLLLLCLSAGRFTCCAVCAVCCSSVTCVMLSGIVRCLLLWPFAAVQGCFTCTQDTQCMLGLAAILLRVSLMPQSAHGDASVACCMQCTYCRYEVRSPHRIALTFEEARIGGIKVRAEIHVQSRPICQGRSSRGY